LLRRDGVLSQDDEFVDETIQLVERAFNASWQVSDDIRGVTDATESRSGFHPHRVMPL
jgi:hypothetical protein